MVSMLKFCIILLLVRPSLLLADEKDFFKDIVSAFPTVDPQHAYQDYCKYSWVTCSNNTVTAIELKDIALHQKLPSSITELSELKKLSIIGCFIEVNWDDINKLKNLIALTLSSNSFSGKIPRISVPLKYLDLSCNEFTQFPDEFPESLEEINLDKNKLSGDFASVNFKLEKLSILKIRYNSLTGGLPDFIKNSASLIYLDISYNSFTNFPENFPSSLHILGLSNNKIFADFGSIDCKFTRLISLNLHANQLTGSIPECINELEDLLILNLGRNNLSGDLSSFIFPDTLDMINLSHNKFTGHLPDSIFSKKRSYINLSHNNFTGNIPNITFIESVKIIDLSYNNLTGEIPDLSHAVKLNELYLNNNNLEINCKNKNFGNTLLKPNTCYLHNNIILEKDCQSSLCLHNISEPVTALPDLNSFTFDVGI
ncbi:uncharacterized protein LOC126324747 [Schistocerca gregaria]|uniref:uncharacterized protein LOC126324747 n=1 Tax=Schistocerca gregaria TaxID=7010 RepID=UPI00211F1CAB|nr:uncharacterized protein LOC126324747 [Schistocerca gregaria]